MNDPSYPSNAEGCEDVFSHSGILSKALMLGGSPNILSARDINSPELRPQADVLMDIITG